MLADILKDKRFNIVFSFLVGMFIAILFKPICKGDNCQTFFYKPPPMKEMETNA